MEVDESGHASMLVAMNSGGDLSGLFSRHRVIACVGAGGVGKTTTTAALALLAAAAGRKTLCLTVDPARRLATSLGIAAFPREELELPLDAFCGAGLQLKAPLTVMMLDAQSTFDALILKYSPTEADARRVLEHRVYQQLSSNLAGTQAYMAIEKMLSVMEEGRFDTILLDTPPSVRALDFLDAPQRMVALMGSPATRALVRAFRGKAGLKLDVLGSGLRRALKSLERITGSGLITEFAELLSAMDNLLDGFDERAKQMTDVLRSEEFAYVLVTAPRTRTINDAIHLQSELKKRDLSLSGLVLNRMSPAGLADASAEDVSVFESLGTLARLSEEGRFVVAALAREQAELEAGERRFCAPLIRSLPESIPVAYVPCLFEDVHRCEDLLKIAAALTGSFEGLGNRRCYSSRVLPLK